MPLLQNTPPEIPLWKAASECIEYMGVIGRSLMICTVRVVISRGCVLELVGAIGGSAAGLASRMAHRLTHPRDATTLLRLLLLLQRLRLPQHDYYITLGGSGGKFCIHERQLEEREQSWVWACPGCSPWQRVAQSTS